MSPHVSALLAAILLAGPATAAAQEESHPLFEAYPGSALSRHESNEFDVYQLITGLDEQSRPQARPIEGKVSRFFYNNPRGRSILEIYSNYRDAFTEAGLEVLFACADDECGPGYAASYWNRLAGIVTKSGSDCRYLAGKLTTGEGTAYVVVMVGRNRHQVDIVELTGMETGLVTVDAEALAAAIERTGHASVYGIYFDTGKSQLKPESKPALDEIAALLRDRPALRLFVVGHTDNVGGFEMNLELSRARAEAVTAALIADYGIDAARLSAHGVGPLAPAASNRGEEGREKNRRVELVAR